METVIKIVTIIGVIATVYGLFMVLMGYLDFSSSRGTGNKKEQYDAIQTMIWGGVTAGIAGGITAAVITALNQIQF